MLFPTLNFLLFFLLVFAVTWGVGDRLWVRKAWLVLASYVFYAQWDARFTLLLLGSSLFNYVLGLRVAAAKDDPARARRWVGAGVAVNLAVLGVFKYFNFFLESLGDLLLAVGWQRDLPFLSIVLPVGISFFTFHGISYLVDVYRGKAEAARDPVDLLLYISFFPQLVAGPIVRASFFLPQLKAVPDGRAIPFAAALTLILGGLFKKVVVASLLAAELVDPVFLDPSGASGADLAVAAYGYAVQIYCDFSAYTDIAIGVALLLGYRFPPNFDQPYRAASLREFWRRWHISLSSWLRDYLYVPLGGNREGAWKTYRNLLLTMLLGGLWHGAAWTFVAWGALHGTGLAVERALFGRAEPDGWRRAVGILVTFHLVCLAWIFFRSQSFGDAMHYLAGLGDWGEANYATPLLVAVVAAALAAQFLPPDSGARAAGALARLPVAVQGALAGLLVAAIDALGPAGVAPFIYFQF